MRRKLYAMIYTVCILIVLGFDLLYNKEPCQMQCTPMPQMLTPIQGIIVLAAASWQICDDHLEPDNLTFWRAFGLTLGRRFALASCASVP